MKNLKLSIRKVQTFDFIIEMILGLLIAGYIVLFSYLSIHRMYALNSYYYDLGIMNQTVYNTSRGYFLEMTNQEFRKNISRLAIHFDPILALFAPFYWVFSGPEILLIGQTIILASGALAIFLIGRKILKDKKMALVFACSYLFFWPVQRANLFDFHAVTLATAFILWAIYFSLQKSRLPTLLFIFLALLTKEHVGLIIFLYGLYLIFIKKDKGFGFLVSFLGIVFFFISFFIIIPYFRQQTHFALKYYSDFGDTPSGLVIGIIKNPKLIIKYLFQPESLKYLARLFLPFLPYFVFSPLIVFLSLPEILINLLSANPNMREIYFHYNSLIVPFIFFAGIAGAAKIVKTKLKYFILIIFIFLNLRFIYLYSPLPLQFLKEPYFYTSINKDKLETIKKWQKIFADDNLKISTTPKLAPFFTTRRYYYNFLFDPSFENVKISKKEILEKISKYDQSDYVIINKEEIGDLNKDDLWVAFYRHLRFNKNFKMIYKDKFNLEVYKRI